MFLSNKLLIICDNMTEDDANETTVEEITISDLNNMEGIYYIQDVNCFECAECSLQFQSKEDFVQHSKENHEEKEKISTRPECPECNITFSRRNNLLRHLKKFHQLCIPRIIYDESHTHKCPACDVKFTRKSNLLRHIRRFHAFLVPTVIRQRPKIFACPKCNTGFTKLSNCKRHMKHFHSESELKAFESKFFINRELKLKFDLEECTQIEESVDDLGECVVMPCSNCDLVFCKTEELQEHIESIHSISLLPDTSEMKICPLCSYYDTKLNLYLHFTSVHDCPILIEGQDFESVEEFNNWLQCMEAETSSKFVELPTKRVKTEASSKKVFVCSRTKENELKGETGGFCPAEINFVIHEDKCESYFVKTHVGHDVVKVEVK